MRRFSITGGTVDEWRARGVLCAAEDMRLLGTMPDDTARVYVARDAARLALPWGDSCYTTAVYAQIDGWPRTMWCLGPVTDLTPVRGRATRAGARRRLHGRRTGAGDRAPPWVTSSRTSTVCSPLVNPNRRWRCVRTARVSGMGCPSPADAGHGVLRAPRLRLPLRRRTVSEVLCPGATVDAVMLRRPAPCDCDLCSGRFEAFMPTGDAADSSWSSSTKTTRQLWRRSVRKNWWRGRRGRIQGRVRVKRGRAHSTTRTVRAGCDRCGIAWTERMRRRWRRNTPTAGTPHVGLRQAVCHALPEVVVPAAIRTVSRRIRCVASEFAVFTEQMGDRSAGCTSQCLGTERGG